MASIYPSPALKAQEDAQRKQAAQTERARLTLRMREALSTREGRFLARWFLRLVDSSRPELAPTSGSFDSNAMTMARKEGALDPIRDAWRQLGEMARQERLLMEQEDHDERNVHTN